MTLEADENPLDDWQVDSLLAFDAALAAGHDPGSGRRAGASLGSVHDCQRLLESVWPRSAATPPDPPRQLGKFSILHELGRGGFGVVFLASDTVLGRTVALKVPHPEVLVSPEARRRFVREAEAASRLDHPNIVPVFEVGQAGPVGYIASAYCSGGTLAGWLRRQTVPVFAETAARLTATLAEAVGHAHDRGIVHRDLKPSNILLQPIDPRLAECAERTGALAFVPRIGDFGLAKLVDGDDQETRSGVPIGSPTYMAPEQAQGRPHESGPLTDIYALGVVLYEVLTGRPPLQGDTQLETLRLVVDQDPPPPRALRPGIPRDLETICMKCLEKRPARRYSDAAHLADDLRRFLAGRPITARPLPPWEHAWKWTRRRPAWAALVAVLGFALLGLFLGLAWSSANEKQHSAALRVAYDQARASETKADAQRRLAEEHERQAYRHSTGSQIKLAQSVYEGGDIEGTIDILDSLRPEPGRPDDRGFAWSFLKRLCGRQLSVSEKVPNLESVAVSPDGQIVAVGDREGNVLLWNPNGGRMRRLHGDFGAHVERLAFSPDGRTLAACGFTSRPGEGLRSRVRLWDVASGRVWQCIDEGLGRVYALVFDPDGSQLVTLETTGRLPPSPNTTAARFWDLSPDRSSASFVARWGPQELAARLPSVLPAESLLLESGQTPALVDREKNGIERTTRLPRTLALSPDGSLIAVAERSGEIRFFLPGVGCWAATGMVRNDELCVAPLWLYRPLSENDVVHIAETARRMTGLTRARTFGAGERVLSARFSCDGRNLATLAGIPQENDTVLRLTDLASGRTIHDFGTTGFPPDAVHFGPSGHELVYAGQPERLRRWYHGGRPESPSPRGHDGEVWSLAFAPDGRTLASAGDDHVIKLWDVATCRELATLAGHTSLVTAVAYAPDGKTLASASFDRTVRVWDVETLQARAILTGHTDRIRTVAFAPDGRTLASAGNDRTVRLWNLASCEPLAALEGHSDWVSSVLFSPDGETLFSGALDKTIRAWDWRAERAKAVWQTDDQILSMALAPNGRTLAKTERFGTIALWDVGSKHQAASLRGHSLDVLGVAFSTDGRTLATAGRDHTIRLWDPATGQDLLTLEGHNDRVHAVAFSPDGTILASGSHDGVIKFWRADRIHAIAE